MESLEAQLIFGLDRVLVEGDAATSGNAVDADEVGQGDVGEPLSVREDEDAFGEDSEANSLDLEGERDLPPINHGLEGVQEPRHHQETEELLVEGLRAIDFVVSNDVGSQGNEATEKDTSDQSLGVLEGEGDLLHDTQLLNSDFLASPDTTWLRSLNSLRAACACANRLQLAKLDGLGDGGDGVGELIRRCHDRSIEQVICHISIHRKARKLATFVFELMQKCHTDFAFFEQRQCVNAPNSLN